MENNIPAFPRPYSEADRGFKKVQVEAQEGMTLLDYFAGQCVIGLLSVARFVGYSSLSDNDLKSLSQKSYALADALLKARHDHNKD
jgi:16S rRNA G966 N2-methylase RsmD